MTTCKDCVHHLKCPYIECYTGDAEYDCHQFQHRHDYVEVVRCKDCKHYNLFRLECHNAHMNGYIGIDGFCSYGERKDNGK